MSLKKIHLWSAAAALLLGAVACAKGGETNQNTTPNGAANSDQSDLSGRSSQNWIGGGPASTGPTDQQVGPTEVPKTTTPRANDTQPSNNDKEMWKHDGGMSSLSPELEPIAMLSIGQGLPGVGGGTGVGGSTGMGGSSTGVGGSIGVGGSTGTGGFSGTGGTR
jgi:hypothetical protein